jgi:Protein of unknown function (DUF2442)
MSDIARILSAELVIHGVLKVVWDDGYSAVVDLRPVLAKGRIFTFIDMPEHFVNVAIDGDGYSIYWVDDQDRTIDFGTLALREKAETQAELIRLAS